MTIQNTSESSIEEDKNDVYISLSHHNTVKQKLKNYLFGNIHAEDDPRTLPNWRKIIIIFIVALSSISGSMGSMIYMPGLPVIAKDLQASDAALNGTISVYIVFSGIAVTPF